MGEDDGSGCNMVREEGCISLSRQQNDASVSPCL